MGESRGPSGKQLLLIYFVFGCISLALLILYTALLWPLSGSLTRFRAHYQPKASPEDQGNSDGANVTTPGPPRIGTFWNLLSRIRRIEGWKGLYKGIGAFAILAIYLLVVLLIIPLIMNYILRDATIFDVDITLLLVFLTIAYIGSFPFRVITIRSVAQPSSKLYIHPTRTLPALLNDAERRNVLKVYILPGLVAATLLQDFGHFIAFVLQAWWTSWLNPRKNTARVFIVLLTMVPLSAAAAISLCPLEVAVTRLALQKYGIGRNGEQVAPPREDTSLVQRDMAYYSDSRETVILPRPYTSQEPYTGLVDCARCIVREEGWLIFWRGWYVLAFFSWLVGLAPLAFTFTHQ